MRGRIVGVSGLYTRVIETVLEGRTIRTTLYLTLLALLYVRIKVILYNTNLAFIQGQTLDAKWYCAWRTS